MAIRMTSGVVLLSAFLLAFLDNVGFFVGGAATTFGAGEGEGEVAFLGAGDLARAGAVLCSENSELKVSLKLQNTSGKFLSRSLCYSFALGSPRNLPPSSHGTIRHLIRASNGAG